MHTPRYKILLFRGADRLPFLQGQLTQNLDRLRDRISLPGAWCNPRGRVIATGQLLDLGDAIGIALPTAMIDVLGDGLTMYRLRADVNIDATDDDWLAVAISGEENIERLNDADLAPPDEPGASCRSADLIAVNRTGSRRYVEVYGRPAAFQASGLDALDSLDDGQWARERIASGLADIVSENSGQYTPHMLNLDLTGAVSFDKGCYTGQEIVARTENLGRVKRRLNRYRLASCSARIGDKLSDGDRDAGRVVNVAADEILAVTSVDRHQEVLQLGNGTATPLPLPQPQ